MGKSTASRGESKQSTAGTLRALRRPAWLEPAGHTGRCKKQDPRGAGNEAIQNYASQTDAFLSVTERPPIYLIFIYSKLSRGYFSKNLASPYFKRTTHPLPKEKKSYTASQHICLGKNPKLLLIKVETVCGFECELLWDWDQASQQRTQLSTTGNWTCNKAIKRCQAG